MAGNPYPVVPMHPDVTKLRALVESLLGVPVSAGQPLPGGGSGRTYMRFTTESADGGEVRRVVGAMGGSEAENRAFLGFTRHFAEQGLPVPRILGADKAGGFYVMEDLGDLTLAAQLLQWRRHPVGGVMAMAALGRVVGWLPRFQVHGGQGLDYSLCHEGEELDGHVLAADMERFIREFIPRHAPGAQPGRRARMELEVLIMRLETLPREHFCYRDYQCRNMMWRDGPVFLDYQSGRRGPLQYDLASFLYSPDTGLKERERAQLIELYLKGLRDCGVMVETYAFLADFHPMVLVRRLQALGAYAQLAAEQENNAYLKKIPPTMADLRTLMATGKLTLGLPALEEWLAGIIAVK